MIKEIVQDEALLSQPCAPATVEDATVAQDLAETLAALEDAACLSANQIGVSTCIVAYKDENDEARVMFNPVISRALRPYKTSESCLSHEEETKVTRFEKITVNYAELVEGELVNRKMNLEGWSAQLIQHMIDHCKGKLV